MKKLQGHWRGMVVVLAVLLVTGTWIWRGAGHGVALADPPAPLTEGDRAGILALLDEVHLGRAAIIALNPTGEQAESALSSVRTWRESNANTLAALRAAIHVRTVALREIELAIRMGPALPGHVEALAIARQELRQARSGYASALGSLTGSVELLLSDSQQATWAAIKGGHGQTMPIGMLSLGDQQRLDLSRAQRSYHRQHATASTAEERASAVATWESALARILSLDQENVLDAYRGYYADASEAVANAFDTVLPVEEG